MSQRNSKLKYISSISIPNKTLNNNELRILLINFFYLLYKELRASTFNLKLFSQILKKKPCKFCALCIYENNFPRHFVLQYQMNESKLEQTHFSYAKGKTEPKIWVFFS